ncbi:hypothetical protein C8R43DRAFT_353057 [Mycena crocata]|nr:hypothetical protein C8R43DRAFT_353057 [Mycena crocata]
MPTDQMPLLVIPVTDSKTGKLHPMRSTIASSFALAAYMGLAGAFAGAVDGTIYGAWTALPALRVPTAMFAMRHGALAYGKLLAGTGALTPPFYNSAHMLSVSYEHARVPFCGVLLYAFYRAIVVPKVNVPTSGVPMMLVLYATHRFVTPAFVDFTIGLRGA